MLQESLGLVLHTLMDYDWRSTGLHTIILIGPEKCHMENIMDSLKGLPVAPPSKVQAIDSVPYLLSDGKWSNEAISQFPRALQFQVPSTQ